MSDMPGTLPNQAVVMQEPTPQFSMEKGGFGPPLGATHVGGLQPLMTNNRIMLKQEFRCSDLFDECTGCDVQKRYTVHDVRDQLIFTARETSHLCQRIWCSRARALQISINDTDGIELIHLDRPLNCIGCPCSCCYPSCTQSVRVSRGGQFIGTIRERATWAYPVYHIFDDQDVRVLKIRGPCCHIACFDDVIFDVTNPQGEPVGTITKKWMGFFTEAFTKRDNFEIQFIGVNDVNGRSLLLSAAFLIDLMYFEQDNNN